MVFLCPLFLQPRKQLCQWLHVHPWGIYIQAFTMGSDFTKLRYRHWHYAREEGEKLYSDHSRLSLPGNYLQWWAIPKTQERWERAGFAHAVGLKCEQAALARTAWARWRQGMAVGLPSAARRLNSWEWCSRNIFFWVFVGFARLLYVCMYIRGCRVVYDALGQCVSQKSPRHKMGKGRK